ncbi:MAG: LLM class F420-dependent oxidoreductase [Gammaproteobacteria bacterium]|nr:LLM class F420-dependent oxidoreductase [Gammaproteobacteria bacterium]
MSTAPGASSGSVSRTLEFGVHLPHLGRQVDRDSLINFAQQAEVAGYASGWVSDHVAWPAKIDSKYPYTADGSFAPPPDMGWLDPIGTQLFVAGVTTKLRLGFTVLILPYRQPVPTAKQLATLDVLSNGRLILGCGVGWMAEEAAILGMPWDHRGERTNEQLDLFTRLFSESNPSFTGKYYQIPPIGFEPKPVQTPVPVWVGGNTEAAYRRAGTYGQGFHAAFEPADAVDHGWQRVLAHTRAAGRDPLAMTLSLRVYLDTQGTMEKSKSIFGSRDQMLEQIAIWRAIGVSHLILDPVARGGVPGRLDALLAFARDVMPAVPSA